MANKPRKQATKSDKATSEAKATEALKVDKQPQEELISFDEYIAKAQPHEGLVASFKYEAQKTEKGLQDRSESDWKADFEAQSKRVYK